MAMAPGWYQDPFSSGGYVRWWDGERWGASVSLPEGTQVAAPGVPVPLPPPGAAPPSTGSAPAVAPAPAAPPPVDAPPPPAWAPPQAWGAPQPYGLPSAAAPAPFPLATWGRRGIARIIDSLIEAVIMAPFIVWIVWPALDRALASASSTGELSQEAMTQYISDVMASSLSLTLVSIVVTFLYEVPQNRAWGRTLGKRMLAIRIRPRDVDTQLTWGQATIRWGTYAGGVLVVGALFTLIDYLWPLWDKPWRQALHDKTARTVVVPT